MATPAQNHLPSFAHTKRIALIANGAMEDFTFIASLVASYEKIVAVDGGLFHCKKMNLEPDLILGDFDSVTPELLAHYPATMKRTFPKEKDDTDLELAIAMVNTPTCETIALFGGMGHRTDHTINNLNLLYRFPKLIIETERESLFLATQTKTIPCFPGQVVSFLPLNQEVKGVTTKGLKWELAAATLNQHFRSISNVCLLDSIDIHIDDGALICCLNRAEN